MEDREKNTPLYYALKNVRVDAIVALHELGATVDQKAQDLVKKDIILQTALLQLVEDLN